MSVGWNRPICAKMGSLAITSDLKQLLWLFVSQFLPIFGLECYFCIQTCYFVSLLRSGGFWCLEAALSMFTRICIWTWIQKMALRLASISWRFAFWFWYLWLFVSYLNPKIMEEFHFWHFCLSFFHEGLSRYFYFWPVQRGSALI